MEGLGKPYRIQCSITTHINDHSGICLPVFQAGPEIIKFEFFMLGTRLLIEFQSTENSATVVFGEELGLIGEVMDLKNDKRALWYTG